MDAMIVSRRAFLATCASATLSADERPRIAVTIDDFNWAVVREHRPQDWQDALLAPLAERKLEAGCYVIGRNSDSPEGRELVKRWARAGHAIGNHTWSHQFYDRMTYEAFSADMLQADALLRAFPGFKRRFRFPGLHEGETAAKRDGMRTLLATHRYRNGYVTIDTSDWYIDLRLRNRLEKDPAADLAPYRDYYLTHMWHRAQYYDALGRKVLGRPVAHTILMHYNVLNTLYLEDLMRMFESHGWRWIDAEEAYRDPVSHAMPRSLPAGESILWALAKDAKALPADARYPAEDGEYLRAEMDRLGL